MFTRKSGLGSSQPCCTATPARHCSIRISRSVNHLARLQRKVSLDNSLSMGRTARQNTAKLPRPEFLNEQGLIFGACYESDAVLPDGTAPPDIADPITQYVA